ncbi:MAG TPA: hydrogenase expression/formation protein HypE [Anaerolineales bacterium]|nr:hydrogenase expression/formation protein HypE [Anaerolineales bacterium]
MTAPARVNFSEWTCPLPLKNYPAIVMGHGSGGQMMADLIQHLFAPLFDNDLLAQLGDSTVIGLSRMADGSSPDDTPSALRDTRIAFTTDSFVVSPLVFPGGDIGELAVNGTVNDLAMSGARPLFLSAGFILEEGLPMETLGKIATSVAAACRAAGVQLVAGDTKVVNKGHGDGLYLNTSGLGVIPPGVDIAPNRARPGDAVIVSGTMGDHGMAIMSVREGLEFETVIESDTAPLNGLVQAMLAVTPDIHCLRDATRGGLAAVLNELAAASQAGIDFEERRVPVRAEVHAACEMLGLDPFYVANEGKLVAIAPEAHAEALLAAMRAHPLGREAALIGRVTAEHPGLVAARTLIGSSRVVDLPAGELLPRIC